MTVCLEEPAQEVLPENEKSVVVARPKYESELSRIFDGGKQEYWRMANRITALEAYLNAEGRIADHKEAMKYFSKLKSSSSLERQVEKGNLDRKRVNALMVRLESYLYDERLRLAQEKRQQEIKENGIRLEEQFAISPEPRIDYPADDIKRAPRDVYEQPVDFEKDPRAKRDRISCLMEISKRNDEVSERTPYQTFWKKTKNFFSSVFKPRKTKTDFKILTTILDRYTNRHPNPKALAFDIVADRIDGSKLSYEQIDRLVKYKRQLAGMERFEGDESFREMVGRNVEKLDGILSRRILGGNFKSEDEKNSVRSWLDRISTQPNFAYAYA